MTSLIRYTPQPLAPTRHALSDRRHFPSALEAYAGLYESSSGPFLDHLILFYDDTTYAAIRETAWAHGKAPAEAEQQWRALNLPSVLLTTPHATRGGHGELRLKYDTCVVQFDAISERKDYRLHAYTRL